MSLFFMFESALLSESLTLGFEAFEVECLWFKSENSCKKVEKKVAFDSTKGCFYKDFNLALALFSIMKDILA